MLSAKRGGTSNGTAESISEASGSVFKGPLADTDTELAFGLNM
jgi:hypothetical protein